MTQVTDKQILALLFFMQSYKFSFKTTSVNFNDYNGDLSKKWYIDFGYCLVGKRKRYKRLWIPFLPNHQSRYDSARKMLDTINAQIESNEIPKETKKPNEAKDKFLEELERILQVKQLRKKTIQTYLTAAKKLSKYNLANNLNFKALNEQNLVSFQNSLDTPNSYKKIIFSHLRNCFSALYDEKIVKYNPFTGYKLKLRITESDNNNPFEKEQKELIENYLIKNNYDLYLFTRFIFYAFIRPKELIHMKVADINLQNRTVKISGDFSKNNKTEFVPLIKPLYDLIVKSDICSNPKNFYVFGQDLKPSLQRIGMNTPTNWHRQALKELKIYNDRKTVLYGWKHTGNIFAYMSGVDIKLLQKMNRHHSIETTEIYLRKLGVFIDRQLFDASW